MSKAKVRAVGYIRVSTPGQAEEGASLKVQTKRIRGFCKERGWQVVEVYEDAGKSGGNIKGRPELQRLLVDATMRRFGAVVFYDQSRLVRDTRDYLDLNDVFDRLGIRLVDFTSPDAAQDENGEMVGTMKAAMDTRERKRSRRKMLDAFLDKAEAGDLNFGQRIPYGLRWNDDRKLEHDPAEIRVWELIKALRLTHGWSYGQIARLLNDQTTAHDRQEAEDLLTQFGVRPPVHKKYSKGGWRDGTISSMLRGPNGEARVTGELEVSVPDPAKRKQPHRFTLRFPPLMTRREFNQLRALAKQNLSRQPRPVGRGATLSRLLICGRCGRPMNVAGYTAKGRHYDYYGCSGRICKPKEGPRCTMPLIPQRLLERYVVQAIMAVLDDDEKFEAAVLAATGGDEETGRLDKEQQRLEKRLKTLKRKHNRLLDAIMYGGLTSKAGGKKLREVVTAEDQTEADLAEVRQRIAALPQKARDAKEARRARRGWFERFRKWAKLTKVQRQIILRQVVAPQIGGKIVVHAHRWSEFKNPDEAMRGKDTPADIEARLASINRARKRQGKKPLASLPPQGACGERTLYLDVKIQGRLPMGGTKKMAVLGGGLAVPCTCNPLQQG